MKDLTALKLGDDCQAIAAELLNQPELLGAVFEDKKLLLTPSEQERVATIKRYTGERSTADDQRLLMVGALRLLGATDREIERSCGVTRRTIPVLLAELERSGRVTPLKERLVRLVGDNSERSSQLLRKLMEQAMDGEGDQDLASMIKAVGSVNCFQLEKFQLLTGQATERIEQVAGAGRAEVESWLKSAATPIEAVTLPADSKSTGLAANDGEIVEVVSADTSTDTAGGLGGLGDERGTGRANAAGTGAAREDGRAEVGGGGLPASDQAVNQMGQ